jgi:hypothetical protein
MKKRLGLKTKRGRLLLPIRIIPNRSLNVSMFVFRNLEPLFAKLKPQKSTLSKLQAFGRFSKNV